MILAVVTGASSGIGLVAAQLLHESGCKVVGVSRSIELDVHPFTCRRADHSVPQEIASVVEESRSMAPDAMPVLVNCAGMAQFGSYHELSAEEIQRQIAANLLGPMYTIQAILPWMLERGQGHIVNVLSIAAKQPFAGGAAYGASKAGLLMLGRCLSEEYRRQGIRVTAVLPGSTDTPLWDNQSFQPNRQDMLPALAVAECIRDVVLAPTDRSIDEILLMPPKGIL